MKIALSILFFLLLNSRPSCAIGDFEGNGGDVRRLIYSLYYYSKEISNYHILKKLPKPSHLRTDIYFSDNEIIENILQDSLLLDNEEIHLIKSELQCLNTTFRINQNYNIKYEDIVRYLSAMTKIVIDTNSLNKNQVDKILHTKIEISSIDLIDNYGNRVCSTSNIQNNVILISNNCLNLEINSQIKLLLIHEIFRILKIDDDEYNQTFSVIIKNFPYLNITLNSCIH